MAVFDEGSSCVHGEEQSLKALWGALKTVEQKIDNLTLEIRQSLLQSSQNAPNGTGMRERELPRPPPLPNCNHNPLRQHPITRSEPPDLADLTFHHSPFAQPQFFDNYDSDDDIEASLLEEPRRRMQPTFGGPRMGQFQGTHNRYNRNTDFNDYKLKIDIPFFDGHMDIENFLDWLHAVETFLDYMSIAETQQVKLVAYKLRGGASAWWEQLQLNRRREGRDSVRTWHIMKQLLKARFLPSNYEQVLYQQFHHCHQKNRTVNDHADEFYRLSARNNLQETERQQVTRFIFGLSNPIQEKLELNAVGSLNDAVNLANVVEKQFSKSRAPQRWKPLAEFYSAKTKPQSNPMHNHNPQTSNPQPKPSFEPYNKAQGKQPYQPQPSQPSKAANPYTKPFPLKCFKCSQIG